MKKIGFFPPLFPSGNLFKEERKERERERERGGIMRGSFFSGISSAHNARFASGTTGAHKRKKMMLLVLFFVVCLVAGTWTLFRGSSAEGKNDSPFTSSSYSKRSRGKGKQKTLLDSFEKEVHEHVFEPIARGVFGGGSDDDTVSDEER